jgi:hypothetical protein
MVQVYCQEFMWRVLRPEAGSRMMTVMDLGGMSLRRITGKDTLDVIRATSEVRPIFTSQSHMLCG